MLHETKRSGWENNVSILGRVFSSLLLLTKYLHHNAAFNVSSRLKLITAKEILIPFPELAFSHTYFSPSILFFLPPQKECLNTHYNHSGSNASMINFVHFAPSPFSFVLSSSVIVSIFFLKTDISV